MPSNNIHTLFLICYSINENTISCLGSLSGRLRLQEFEENSNQQTSLKFLWLVVLFISRHFQAIFSRAAKQIDSLAGPAQSIGRVRVGFDQSWRAFAAAGLSDGAACSPMRWPLLAFYPRCPDRWIRNLRFLCAKKWDSGWKQDSISFQLSKNISSGIYISKCCIPTFLVMMQQKLFSQSHIRTNTDVYI